MPDQNFNIRVVTTADTRGIQQTSAGLKQLEAQQKTATKALDAGFTGSAVGVGTIITLLTGAINKWKAFSDEQDRMVENMVKSQEKTRAFGLEIADTLDELKQIERINTEPLQVSFDTLTQKVRTLKFQIQDAFGAGNYEETQKYIRQLEIAESQLDRVTRSLQRKTQAEEDARARRQEAEDQFYKGAVAGADINVQRALQQEDAARRAGLGTREADLYLKSAEAYKRGFTPEQAQEYEGLSGAGNQQPVIDAINDLKQQLIGIWR